MAYRAQNFDASSALFICTRYSVHEAFIVDAVLQAKKMSDLVTDEVAATHDVVFVTIGVSDVVIRWIES